MSGWYGLLTTIKEAIAEAEYWRNSPPLACPNDGEPMTTGPDGELYCRNDGWRPSGRYVGT